MKVIEITKPGGPEVLKLSSRTCPEPSTGQVLIKVCYAGSVSYTHLRAHET